MIEELSELSPEELLHCVSERIEYNNIQDHIYFKHYNPNEKQLAFHATGVLAKERAFFAGNRCGKSLCSSAEWSMHLTGNYPDWWNGYRYLKPVNIWVSGVTNAETYQSLKKYYVGDLGIEGFIHSSLIIRKEPQKHLYYIQHSSGGISKLRFKSYEQGAEAWQAETLDGAHMDEEPPYKIYSEAITRTASTSPDHHGMITLSMTPLKGITTMMLKYMQTTILNEDGEEIESRNVAPQQLLNSKIYVLASHDDATHLTEEEKKRLYNSYSPYERDARTKGIPSIGSGLIYHVPEAELLVTPFEIPEFWPRCFGMDFGWEGTAAVFMAHDQDNDVVYLCGEYLAAHLTPMYHAFQIIKQGADWMPGAYDHSGESAMQNGSENVVALYEQAGIRNWFPADKRSVNESIYTVLQRMETGKLKIFRTLTKLMTELRMYARDDNGKVKKGNDHLMDAMRYGIHTALPLARVKVSTMRKLQIPLNNGSSNGNWMRV